jgi:hypothetical protein
VRVGCANLKKDAAVQNVKLYADIRDKRSLIFYCDMTFVWVREAYTDCCTRNVSSGLAWFNIGI